MGTIIILIVCENMYVSAFFVSSSAVGICKIACQYKQEI